MGIVPATPPVSRQLSLCHYTPDNGPPAVAEPHTLQKADSEGVRYICFPFP
jgi:hypothetical protein